jgi:hypothetical protein
VPSIILFPDDLLSFVRYVKKLGLYAIAEREAYVKGGEENFTDGVLLEVIPCGDGQAAQDALMMAGG